MCDVFSNKMLVELLILVEMIGGFEIIFVAPREVLEGGGKSGLDLRRVAGRSGLGLDGGLGLVLEWWGLLFGETVEFYSGLNLCGLVEPFVEVWYGLLFKHWLSLTVDSGIGYDLSLSRPIMNADIFFNKMFDNLYSKSIEFLQNIS